MLVLLHGLRKPDPSVEKVHCNKAAKELIKRVRFICSDAQVKGKFKFIIGCEKFEIK